MARKFTHAKAHPFVGLIRGLINRVANRRKDATNVTNYKTSRVRTLGASFNGTTGKFSKTSRWGSLA